MRKAKFSVVGAGNGGLTMAGDLIFHGFEVTGIYDRYPEAVAPIRERGGIEFLGDTMSGFAPIANATTDLAAAIRGSDVIAVVVPTNAHEWVAQQLAPHLVDEQIVLLTPGYPFGTLLFRKTLQESGLRARVDQAETNLIMYATRIVGPAKVGVQAKKKALWISALPASRTGEVLEVLRPAIPELEPLNNVLEVGFNCTNPLGHVSTVLLNLGRVEQDDGSRQFDMHEWMTPGVLQVKNAMDAERGAIVKAMGIKFFTHAEALAKFYEGVKATIVPMQGSVLEGSRAVPPRYITEDVPMGLVAWASMGRALGVPTPTVDALIHLAGIIKGRDYWKEGRTLERVGLASKSMAEILDAVNA